VVKFLIIRFSSIGDIVLTTPVVRNLKQQVDGAEVHYLTKKQYAGILETNPFVDKVHILDESFTELIPKLRAEYYHYIIDLHKNLRTLRVKSALRNASFSFNKINWEKWLIVNLKVNKLPELHIVDRYLETIKVFIEKNDLKGLDYFIPEKDELSITSLPANFQNGYIAFAIGAQHATKKLPTEKVISLCKKINNPIILLGDIPEYVESGVADLGIVGQNVVWEKTENVQEIKQLGFGKCRLSLAVDKNYNYRSIDDINSMQIATSYPNILKKHLNKNNVKAKIHKISGSVEIAPGIGLANAVCDIVSTGSTLTLNGLKEVETILKSQAVLIATKNLPVEKQSILDKLTFRLDAVQKAKDNKYILLNAPNNKIDVISDILPGMKSPTVVPLVGKGWSSVHSVVNENEFWEVIEKLRDNGAEGILVMPIEKMIV